MSDHADIMRLDRLRVDAEQDQLWTKDHAGDVLALFARAEAAEAEVVRLREALTARWSQTDSWKKTDRRTQAAEAEVARLEALQTEWESDRNTIALRAADLEAEVARLREALLAWWEPQRHVGDCACRACTLTRAALAGEET